MAKRAKKNADNSTTESSKTASAANCMTYSKADCPPNPWRISRLPIQRLTDKLAHDNALLVCTDGFDIKTKSACYVVAVSAHDTKQVCYSYDEICKNFGWDSFSVTRDKLAVKPRWTEVAK